MKEQNKPGPGLGKSESSFDELTCVSRGTDASVPAPAVAGQGPPPADGARYRHGKGNPGCSGAPLGGAFS
jgi:hypothetical protein